MEENKKLAHESTTRDDELKKDLITRINKIEGQVRGIKQMIENDRYCVDILMQSAAASAAISSFNRRMLDSHIRTCVKNDILNGDESSIDELLKVLEKFMKGSL